MIRLWHTTIVQFRTGTAEVSVYIISGISGVTTGLHWKKQAEMHISLPLMCGSGNAEGRKAYKRMAFAYSISKQMIPLAGLMSPCDRGHSVSFLPSKSPLFRHASWRRRYSHSACALPCKMAQDTHGFSVPAQIVSQLCLQRS